jgi:hypothetical protein
MITVIKGTYRKRPVDGIQFKLVQPFSVHPTSKEGFILVDGSDTPGFSNNILKIKLDNHHDYEPVTTVARKLETEEEAIARIAERFDFLHQLVGAANDGRIRGLIVSGGAGVGKSYEVEKVLQENNVLDALAWNADSDDDEDARRTIVDKQGEKKFQPRFSFEKGTLSAVMLFVKLHRFSNPGEVLVLDDCDGIFHDLDALNLLKAALDTGNKRIMTYNKDSNVLKQHGVPTKFEFKGTVIFITNIDFEHVCEVRANSSIVPHLLALMSRTHYLDLTMQSVKDRIVRVKHVHRTENFLGMRGCDAKAAEEVIAFLEENAEKLREVSLRMAISIAEKRALSPDRWRRMTQVMEFKKEYRGK